MTDLTTPADINSQRQAIRQQVRKLRNALSAEQQQQAAQLLVGQMLQLPQVKNATAIALYLSNDAELDTSPLIQALWQAGKQIYLPVLHPFVPGYLIFQRYQQDTPMKLNRFQIPEPVLNCVDIIPVAALDVICTPLVAFDAQGNRLGMGGGFYDRTLAQLETTTPGNSHGLTAATPVLIGLAHQCQQVANIPVEAWDIPLPIIATPGQIFRQS
ncbi:5-formyltetrahydrofolate cyclo-ligase [Rheinheimera sp. 4Y26]|uniref:5-formyltetrahydrofolate cyclo-ligase n=1 Tax=Rheinheimera sp. 4Y26 TaxID=2977811 RepID=UPI0021B0CD24|nr:5-formyltetrahydrofolate cyclo-ligase [Rheinheimera sp. 4Y26]MCT6700334.1 5-formyltetrahydrofolate cyclo-ligase [Rheinheimera sp. 4Y26]